MNLVPLNIDTIQIGQPLPFMLRGTDGVLLASRGYVIGSREELDSLVARGRQLCVDVDESGDSHRAYLAQLQKMLMADTSLGELAAVKIPVAHRDREREERQSLDWPALQLHATRLLRAPDEGDFLLRLEHLHEELVRRCTQAPDATLLALVYLSTQETRMYSATHAMLVSCACMLAARSVLRWPEVRVLQVGRVALSMNIGMTELQDQLAQQAQPLTSRQIASIQHHAARSEAVLHSLGVQDADWLEAVRCHHDRSPGPLADRSPAQQMARLVQRAVVFAARLAPRANRWPMPATAAMQASYYDEERKVDEAGAALVKALGVYPPGSFVRLITQEVAVVLRRGASATTPRVAVVMNRQGMATGEFIPRDTALSQWKIASVVALKDVRVNLSLERLLAML